MTQQDRRLVLVICGDEATSYLQWWLDTPCDDHGTHVLTSRIPAAEGWDESSSHQWLMRALKYAADNVCLCGAEEAPHDAVTSILEATRA